MESHAAVFHADLSHVRDELDCFIAVNGTLHPLERHSPETRLQARRDAPHLGRVADERLTHFTAKPVAMGHGAAIRVHVAYREKDGSRPKGGPHAGHAAIYCPPSAAALRAGNGPLTVHQHVDWVETAKTFLFHHSDLNTKDPEVCAVVQEHMDEEKARESYALIEQLADAMRDAGEPESPQDQAGWYSLEAVKYKDQGEDLYLHHPRPAITEAARPALRALMLSTKNDLRLKDKKWRQLDGVGAQTHAPQRLGTLRADGGFSAALEKEGFYVDGIKAAVKFDNNEDRQNRIVRLEIENIYVRYLAAYIQFLKADGTPLQTPDWTPEGGLPIWFKPLQGVFPDLQEPDFRFLGTIDPIDTILAVPNPLLPGRLVGEGTGWGVRMQFPKEAASAGIYGCGLGTGENRHPGACMYGEAFTIICNLLVPAIMMAFDVAKQSYKPLYDFIQTALSKTAVKVVGAIGYIAKTLYSFIGSVVQGRPDWTVLVGVAKTIFGAAFGWLLEKIEEDLGEAAAVKIAEQIPFAGWIISAASIVADVAQMAETVVEVVSSPWQIPNSVHTEITTQVHLKPDPQAGAFPTTTTNQKARYVVTMVYKRGTPSRIFPGDVPGVPPKQVDFEFRNPLGDEVKFEADYLVDGEVRAKATTGWLPNDVKNASSIDLVLVQRPVALKATSVYKHATLLTYRGDAYGWTQTAQAPDATYKPDPSQTGNAMSEWNGLALSQRRHRLGWAWKAAGTGLRDCAGGTSTELQLHAFMSVGIPGTDAAPRWPTCGFVGRSNVVFDPFPPKFKKGNDGNWVLDKDGNPIPDDAAADLGDYYVDPRKAEEPLEKDGGYHLRRLPKDDAPIDPRAAQRSFARFQYAPESMALHPSGYVVGLSHEFHKIQVARLAPDGAPDDALAVGRVYSGKGTDFGGSGGRPGLLVQPIAVTCTYDGTILILENLFSQDFTLARVQAFDVQGNPVAFFPAGTKEPSPFLELPVEKRTYLDVSAVGDKRRTYLFVLYYEGSGDLAGDYRLAVYQTGEGAPQGGKPLLTSPGLSAARIAADMWNTVYALNYAMTTDGAGHPAGPKGDGTGPAGRTAPSLSAWVPVSA